VFDCGNPEATGCNSWCQGDAGSPLENDECDVCGGSGYKDNCGTCDDDPSNDCIADCTGTWGGDLLDTCFGYTFDTGPPPEEESEENCVAGGGYWSLRGFDECGICNGPGIPPGDCDCFGNIEDQCGICDGGGIPEGECDCDGNEEDDCGVCGGDGAVYGNDEDCCAANLDDCDADPNNDCVQDCIGDWGGEAVVDACGICGGSGEYHHRIYRNYHIHHYPRRYRMHLLLLHHPSRRYNPGHSHYLGQHRSHQD
jgi:hypothetical protein